MGPGRANGRGPAFGSPKEATSLKLVLPRHDRLPLVQPGGGGHGGFRSRAPSAARLSGPGMPDAVLDLLLLRSRPAVLQPRLPQRSAALTIRLWRNDHDTGSDSADGPAGPSVVQPAAVDAMLRHLRA